MSKITVIDRDGGRHEEEALDGLPLMETLRDLDYGVAATCGGVCACATCHVFVDEAWLDRLPPADEEEADLIEELAFEQPNSRLSCQIEMTPELVGLTVTIAPDE